MPDPTPAPVGRGAFLGLPPDACDPAAARVAVLPVPYEASVSYGGGTAHGPDALLEASRQVELYDRRHDDEPALRYGAVTLPAVVFDDPPPAPGGDGAAAGRAAERALARIADAAARAAEGGRFVLALGGEHALTPGVFDGVARARGDGPYVVVHFDAHADLRDDYEGNPHSHACAARRLLDHPACERVVQLGIRSLCAEEAAFIRAHPARVATWFAEDLRAEPAAWRASVADAVRGRRVFVTFDVDALDPAVVPGTGTPEPDGLSWREALHAADLVADAAGAVVAMDVVEAAPAPGLAYSEFNVAKLTYAMLSRFLGVPFAAARPPA